MSSNVDVVNSSGLILHRVSVRHAVTMLVRQVVTLVEEDPTPRYGPWGRPRVVRLVRDVFARWLQRPAFCTKAGVLRRDGHRCAYCGGHGDTVDHIVPRCRGGTIEWLNAVAACSPCNARKADRTPEEAGMPLRFAPWEPRRIDVLPQ